MLRPSVESGLVLSWAGVRGIVSLAAALALPRDFPYRDLIVLTAFAVVLGTLIIQGLTLKPLLRVLKLNDDDPVGREVFTARERALGAGLAVVEQGDSSPIASSVRRELVARLGPTGRDGVEASRSLYSELRGSGLRAARQAVLQMRTDHEIGDDAFHRLGEELDWLEMVESSNPE
jgi:NhaP-type Na+/H+ or K+/H+ antiporter